MTTSGVQTRIATPQDEPFLRRLFFAVRAPEFQAAGLSPEQLDELLGQQYKAMRSHYDQVFADAEYRIIEADGESIGYEATVDRDTIHLLDIALMPEWRNQGIGTARMELLQERARQSGKSLTLSVEKFNPALRLYERLGFRFAADMGIYQRMQWGCVSGEVR